MHIVVDVARVAPQTSDFCTVNAWTAKSRADGKRGEGWRANSFSLF